MQTYGMARDVLMLCCKPCELMCFAQAQPQLALEASPPATAAAEPELQAAEPASSAQPQTDHSQPLSYQNSAHGVDDNAQQGLPVEEQTAAAAAAEPQQASLPVPHGPLAQPQAAETQAESGESAQAQHAEREGCLGSIGNLDTQHAQQQSSMSETQNQQGGPGDTQQAEQDTDEQMQDVQQAEFGNALLNAAPQQSSLAAAAAAAAAPDAAVEQHNAEAMVPLPEGLLQDSQQSPEAQRPATDASQANQVHDGDAWDACTDQPSTDTVMLEAEHGQQSDGSHPDEAQHAQQVGHSSLQESQHAQQDPDSIMTEAQHAQQAGHSNLQEAQHAQQELDSVMTEALPPQEHAGSVRPEPQHAQHDTLSSCLDSSQEPPRRSRRLVGSGSKADGEENAADCPETAGSSSPLPAAPPSGDAAQAGSSVAAKQGVGKQSMDEGQADFAALQADAGAEVSHAQQDLHPHRQGNVSSLGAFISCPCGLIAEAVDSQTLQCCSVLPS